MTETRNYPLGEIHAFDFDGTLTRRDTLLEFIRFAKGTKAFALCFLRFSPLLVLMKIGLYPNWKAKQRVFAYCFKGMAETDFNALCARFAKEKAALLRPKGMQRVADVLAGGGKAVIISASLNNWVGRFATKNCYGREKVNRLLQLYPERSEYRLVAYGDSRGDTELLDFADESHYKPFRK